MNVDSLKKRAQREWKNLAPLLKNFTKSLDRQENIFPTVYSKTLSRAHLRPHSPKTTKKAKILRKLQKKIEKVWKSVAKKLWTAKIEFLNPTF